MSEPVSPLRSGVGVIAGPFALRGWGTKGLALAVTVALTVITQVGGVVLWPFWTVCFEVSRPWPIVRRWPSRVLFLLACYVGLCQLGVPLIAAQTGRVRLPSFASEQTPVEPLWLGYALLNRNYVRPHTHRAFVEASRRTAAQHPGTVVRYLDAGFPFPFPPLLPHLSHADGQRIDVAFFFESDGTPVDAARSPIGYWGYAAESPTRRECDGVRQRVGPLELDLRWDFEWMQAWWPDLQLDVARNRTFFAEVAKEKNTCSILLEPTLHRLLGAPKLRANGCSVARHDDHSHLSIKQGCR